MIKGKFLSCYEKELIDAFTYQVNALVK